VAAATTVGNVFSAERRRRPRVSTARQNETLSLRWLTSPERPQSALASRKGVFGGKTSAWVREKRSRFSESRAAQGRKTAYAKKPTQGTGKERGERQLVLKAGRGSPFLDAFTALEEVFVD